MKSFNVHVLNPKKKAGGKRTTTTKRKAKKVATANPKRKRRRRKARRNPNPAPRRRRRSSTRRSNPRRRRRRSNPSGGMLMSQVKDFVPRLLGKLFVAFAVRRWGQRGSIMGGEAVSPMYGTSWTLGGYVVAILATHIGARLFGRFVSSTEFRKGGWDLILTKLVWTEGFSRSPWLQQTFGQAEGQVTVDQSGQTWIYQGGRWQAMQGIVESSPLDGIVEQSALDGDYDYEYGHLLPEGTSPEFATHAAYQGSGYMSPYDAAYATR